MAHAKPQVTIDLDEYNELRTKDNLTPSVKDMQELRVHRLLFDALVRSKGNMKDTLTYMLVEHKITLSTSDAYIPKNGVIPMMYKQQIG